MLFTSFFDALSTFMAISEAGKLFDENGNPRNIRQSMMVDAFVVQKSATGRAKEINKPAMIHIAAFSLVLLSQL